MKKLSVIKYFAEQSSLPIIDVRSPGEFAKAHIPDAVNIPLFSNDERAEVGTLYKRKGPRQAMMRGLEFAGQKLTHYVQEVSQKVDGNEIVVHCWRGGKRSASMATLFEFMGFEVTVLEGGYKAYRNFVLNRFIEKKLKLIVLGGPTGSGKTKVLEALRSKGEQVIDLEGLARHRGSTFGALGMGQQPTSEQFENDLFEVFQQTDPARPVWVENESRSIGSVYIPVGLWDQMVIAPLVDIEIPLEKRVDNLVEEYGGFSGKELIECLEKITRRMGGQNVKAAKEAFAEGNLRKATEIALEYYDKSYRHSTLKKSFSSLENVKFETSDFDDIAAQLIDYQLNRKNV